MFFATLGPTSCSVRSRVFFLPNMLKNYPTCWPKWHSINIYTILFKQYIPLRIHFPVVLTFHWKGPFLRKHPGPKSQDGVPRFSPAAQQAMQLAFSLLLSPFLLPGSLSILCFSRRNTHTLTPLPPPTSPTCQLTACHTQAGKHHHQEPLWLNEAKSCWQYQSNRLPLFLVIALASSSNQVWYERQMNTLFLSIVHTLYTACTIQFCVLGGQTRHTKKNMSLQCPIRPWKVFRNVFNVPCR